MEKGIFNLEKVAPEYKESAESRLTSAKIKFWTFWGKKAKKLCRKTREERLLEKTDHLVYR